MSKKSAHPGEVLRQVYLEPRGMSCNAAARELRVPVARVTEIVRGRRSVTADTALRLARLFLTTPEFWMDLQRDYDLAVARAALGRDLELVKPSRLPSDP
jgi:addiction module HigA family antidote